MSFMVRITVLIGILLAVLVSCDSNILVTGDGKASNPPDDGGHIDSTSFPRAIGMYWSYGVYDGLTDETDTVEVAVTDTISGINLGLTTIWRQLRNGSAETSLWEDRGDSIIIYDGGLIGMPVEKFLLPFELNATWSGPADRDTSEVVAMNSTVTVPAGQIDIVTQVDRRWNGDFEGGGDFSSTWIADNIGIVMRYRHAQYSDGAHITVTQNEVWKLLDYDLNTFGLHEYPMTIGTHWTYNVLDTNMNVIDTLIVTIAADTVTTQGQPATVWTYDYGSRVDSEIVWMSTSSIHHRSPMPFPSTYYCTFPLSIGDEWGVVHIVPVPEIVDKGAVSVPAGDFQAGFLHRWGDNAVNYAWSIDSWLVPNVGLVKRRLSIANLGPMVTVHWELTDYYIAP